MDCTTAGGSSRCCCASPLSLDSRWESPTAVPAGALGPAGEHAEQQAAADDGDLRPATLTAGKDVTTAKCTADDGSHQHRDPPADEARVAPPATQPGGHSPCHRRLGRPGGGGGV